MSETGTLPAVPDPAAAGVPGAAAAPATPPEGFVSQAELERVEAQRRSLQSELDRLKAAPPPAPVPPAPAPTSAATKSPSGFDPEAFSREVAVRAAGATALTLAADKLKGEFEYADPTFFDPDVITDFATVEALRAAVEADHNRVKALVDAKVAAAAPAPPVVPGQTGSPLGPGNPAAAPAAGDPTAAQLAGLSPAQLATFRLANPGVVERVLSAAG